MINFVNQEFDKTDFGEKDLFICAFGYEERSMALYKKIKKVLLSSNILIFVFDDYKRYDYIANQIDQVINEEETIIEKVQYESDLKVYNSIKNMIQVKMASEENITVHIDYSSMPRKWYCRLPLLLKKDLRKKDNLFFWYVAGVYPANYEVYQSAGIDSFSVLGKPSLRIGTKRMHIVGLGYDSVRTGALISILDPDSYITCNAYNRDNKEISDNVRSINEQIISRASMEIILQINDFSFMISKLCEIANEYLPLGDVILVPDGPKPLIFAMSMVPLLLERAGITCLHVSRNKEHYKSVNVESMDKIYGFSVME
ncbi:MAG: hypothetical protein NC392_03470 [Roseburia sp.]|nr:hypothetical protein [Roseburia sp.]